jgi:hypothetical protein
MAEADCGFCRLMGYWACDVCGGPVFSSTLDVCGYCERPAEGSGGTRIIRPPAPETGRADPQVAGEDQGVKGAVPLDTEYGREAQ